MDEVTATNTNEADVTGSLLSNADQPVVSENESILDTAGAEEKAAREAEDKRLLETPDDKLTEEDKPKKAELVKQKQEAADKKLAEIKAQGVPDKYEIKPPEGFEIEEAKLAKATEFFKEAGFTNKQAQMAVDYEAKLRSEEKATADAVFKEWNENNVKETMKALGASAKQELAYVAKVKNLMSAETIESLNASGIGNLKHFIYDMAKIGRLFSEEHLVNDKATRKPSSTEKSRDEMAEQFYPTMVNK